MSIDKEYPIRLMVVTSNSAHRRVLRSVLSKISEIDLVETTSSALLTRYRLEQQAVDALVLDDSKIGLQLFQEVQSRLLRDRVQLIVFRSDHDTERVLLHILSSLEIAPEKYISTIKKTQQNQPHIVVVGCSTGGPDALHDMIALLPPRFSPTVLVAQHMLPTFTPILARRLHRNSALEVREAADGDPLTSGVVLLAPGDFHMVVNDDELTVQLHRGPPEHSCRPSVDVLFRSVADTFGDRAIGVVLTGMGRDGVDGARVLRSAGAEILVQDEETSVVWGMPGVIHKEGIASFIGCIPEIAQYLSHKFSNVPSHGEIAEDTIVASSLSEHSKGSK